MRRLEPLLLGLVLAIALIGVSVRLLTAPIVTDALFLATGEGSASGLEPKLAGDLAQEVRAYVTGANPGPLPEYVGGRAGFSADAVSHLDDVRRVISGAGVATFALFVLAVVWIALRWRGERGETVVAAMRAASLWILIGVPVLAALALVDFNRFFAAFHSLFFKAGTWQFAADELLIQLFPEPFWASAGALWALLVVIGAVALLAVSVVLRRRSERDRLSLR